MVSVVDFFVSINKIALFAFVVVLGFLIFEIKKTMDDKKKEEKPTVPQFVDAVQPGPVAAQNSTPLPAAPKPIKKSNHNNSVGTVIMILIGVVSLIGLIVVMVLTYNTKAARTRISSTPVPIVREISSAGLKVYDTDWTEIEGKKKDKTKPGEVLYIAIQTIVEADIDRARIKINERDWQIGHITTLYNPKLKVYYKEYTVATGTAQLKIDAQLHSASDGWLGD
ncbi:MAG: hypothetical protein WAV30_04300 [Microgenomates group bacterium]